MDKEKKGQLELKEQEQKETIAEPIIKVGFESFEEIRQKNQEKKESIEKWNSGFESSSSSDFSTHGNEQINWGTSSNYVGKGHLW